jgi:hypothetical protein
MLGSRREGSYARIAVAAVVLACASGGLAAGASGHGTMRDGNPPRFDGLQSATTCIPGPVGGGTTTSYHLAWIAATDDRTRSSQIVYDVYQAGKAGGEDFSSPTYTTRRGATSFDTPALPTGESVYFVVRARDRAGNRDSNVVERQGVNLCV